MVKRGVKYVAVTLAVAGVIGGVVVGGINANASKNANEQIATVENNDVKSEANVMETVDNLLKEGATPEELSLAFISIQAEACQEMAEQSGKSVDEDSIIKELDKKVAEYEAQLKEKEELQEFSRGIKEDHDNNLLDPNEYYDWGIFEFLNFTYPDGKFTFKDCIYDFHEIIGDIGASLGECFTAWKSFNYEEKKLAIKYPADALEAYTSKQEVIEYAEKEFGACEPGTQADAFRQALWTLDMTLYIDQDRIVEFVEASVSDVEDSAIKEMTVSNCEKGMALRNYHESEGKTIATLMTIDEQIEAVKEILTNDKATGLYWVK